MSVCDINSLVQFFINPAGHTINTFPSSLLLLPLINAITHNDFPVPASDNIIPPLYLLS